MNSNIQADKSTYAGLFLIALSTLMYELLLTRIFSVTMWYHFAFMAISIAMFGLTVGGLIVYLLPRRHSPALVKYNLALYSTWFAAAIVVSLFLHLHIPLRGHPSFTAACYLVLTYVLISVPFVFSGLCICLVLTRFQRQVNKLYAIDLLGAALGCFFFLLVFEIVDGLSAVIVIALLANIGALCFATQPECKRLRLIAGGMGLLLIFSAALQTGYFGYKKAFLKLRWVKGGVEYPQLHEKWNSFSRIRVIGDLNNPEKPFGWGLSATLPAGQNLRQLMLIIDASASTPLTSFDGNLDKLNFLKFDVTNVVHHIRPHSHVFIIGSGGGRDVLAALVFDQTSVTAVEFNKDILDALNVTFGDFTGHLDRHPRVTFINDEARSYLARHDATYDIIQVSLVDTWAATAAGALALTENSLYTVEGWNIFLNRLKPAGILSCSRYFRRDIPGEMLRLTALAYTSLINRGIQDPRQHIMIVRQLPAIDGPADPNSGIGTILVSRDPFSDRDIAAMNAVVTKMRYELVLSPRHSLEPMFSMLASGKVPHSVAMKYPHRLSAPTDNRPYFFYMTRLKDTFNRNLWKQGSNMQVTFVLGILLMTVLGLITLCIITPLALTTQKSPLAGTVPLFVFFAGIGLGFMMIEISQMQRLIIFLGHPTYALSVVLLTLLASSGLGSYLTRNIHPPGSNTAATVLLLSLLGTLVICGFATPYATTAFEESSTAQRIGVAVGLLFSIGLLMGMPFPLGMKLASASSPALTPWLWGINGAASVCASVLAFIVCLESGISTAYWIGVLCYLGAFAAFMRHSAGRTSRLIVSEE